jgi:Flp pilus assembly protein TadD
MNQTGYAICNSCGASVSEDDMIFGNGDVKVCATCVASDRVNLAPADVAEIYYQAGLDLISKDKPTARKYFLKSIELQKAAKVYAALASVTDDLRQQESLLRRAISLDGNDLCAVANMPFVLAAQGKYADALEWLETHAYPDEIEKRMLRARLLKALGRKVEAEREFSLVLAEACACEQCQQKFRADWRRRKWR